MQGGGNANAFLKRFWAFLRFWEISIFSSIFKAFLAFFLGGGQRWGENYTWLSVSIGNIENIENKYETLSIVNPQVQFVPPMKIGFSLELQKKNRFEKKESFL